MCGLAGIISFDERYRITRELLERMNAQIVHRGPDGQGVHLNHEQTPGVENPQVGLAHCRLAIIDLDPRANQPFVDDHGRWIVFNGEIYNYRELRCELERVLPEYRWKTTCDTEVLLAAYAAWGEGCTARLNGMYAFAIWDGVKNELFLARDRMGQKPLYVAIAGENSGSLFGGTGGEGKCGLPLKAIAFASELGALRQLPWFEDGIDEASLLDYLRWGFYLPTATVYKGVRTLAQGQRLTVSASSTELRDHDWEADPAPPPGDDRATTRRVVDQAVERQMVADVPVGCFLSGGIDSSVVACAASHGGRRKLLTFSIGFDDPRYDETKYARQVAAHLRTEHREFVVKPDAAEDLPRLAMSFGQPFADSSALPTHYLSRQTRGHVKVALSGDGGDELFGGYDRYRAMALGHTLRALLGPLAHPVGWLARLLPGVHPKGLMTRLKRFLKEIPLEDGARYSAYMRLFSQEQLDALWPDRSEHPDAVRQAYGCARRDANMDEVAAALFVDRSLYLPCDLLTKLDRCSMLHALEVRSPFMDHEVVRFASQLRADQLIAGGPKRMLREAYADALPGWVFSRKKMGFAVPIGEWFRTSLRTLLRDHLLAGDSFCRGRFHMQAVEQLIDQHERQTMDHSQRLYALLMLELWWKGHRAATSR